MSGLRPNMAAHRVQRWWRRRRPLNDTCPITQDKLRPPVFRFYQSADKNKRPIGYTLASVLENIQVSGKLQDPMTRKEYSESDLKRIDHLMTLYKLHDNYLSPLKARKKLIDAKRAETLVLFRTMLDPSEDVLASIPVFEHLSNMMQCIARSLGDLAQLDRREATVVCQIMRTDFARQGMHKYTRMIKILGTNAIRVFFLAMADSVGEI